MGIPAQRLVSECLMTFQYTRAECFRLRAVCPSCATHGESCLRIESLRPMVGWRVAIMYLALMKERFLRDWLRGRTSLLSFLNTAPLSPQLNADFKNTEGTCIPLRITGT